jgi:hypothetical protein
LSQNDRKVIFQDSLHGTGCGKEQPTRLQSSW